MNEHQIDKILTIINDVHREYYINKSPEPKIRDAITDVIVRIAKKVEALHSPNPTETEVPPSVEAQLPRSLQVGDIVEYIDKHAMDIYELAVVTDVDPKKPNGDPVNGDLLLSPVVEVTGLESGEDWFASKGLIRVIGGKS